MYRGGQINSSIPRMEMNGTGEGQNENAIDGMAFQNLLVLLNIEGMSTCSHKISLIQNTDMTNLSTKIKYII